MNTSLFRSAAVAARNSQWLGAIVLSQPVPMRIAAAVAVIFACGLLTFLGTSVYTSRIRVQGELAPLNGAIHVASPQFGRVTARYIREGQHVETGQVLYEISSGRITEEGNLDDRIQASLDERRKLLIHEQELQAQQATQQQQALVHKRSLAKAAITRLESEITLQRGRVAASAGMLERYKALHADGFLPQIQLVQHQAEHADLLSRVHALERTMLEAKRDLTQADNEISQVRSQSAINAVQVQRALENLTQEDAEQQGKQHIRVLAPSSGTVTALLATVGQTMGAGMQMATIIPSHGELEAHLYAPASAIGFVAEGQPVRLMIKTFPYQKFGYIAGTVIRIEQDTIIAPEKATNSAAPVYRITASLSQQAFTVQGKRHRLLPGMTLDAEIRQEQRRLFEWVLSPILPASKAQHFE